VAVSHHGKKFDVSILTQIIFLTCQYCGGPPYNIMRDSTLSQDMTHRKIFICKRLGVLRTRYLRRHKVAILQQNGTIY
jgi:hypothetical protein